MPPEPESKVVRIIPALSIESGVITVRLRECKPGDIVTYAELDALIGKSIQRHRGSLDTARRTVERDDRMVFEAVRGVGVKCLTSPEAALSLATNIKRTRMAARKGVRKARAIKIEEVPQSERGALIARASYLALVDNAGAPAAQKRLAESAQTQDIKTLFLPMQRALEALREA